MGNPFSGQDIIVVGTSVTRIISVKPTPIASAIIDSVLNNAPLTPNIVGATLFGFGASVRSYLNYGKNHFTNGLPVGTYVNRDFVITAPILSVLSNVEQTSAYTASLDIKSIVLSELQAGVLAGEFLQNFGFEGDTINGVNLLVPDLFPDTSEEYYFYSAEILTTEKILEITFEYDVSGVATYITIPYDIVGYIGFLDSDLYYHVTYTDAEGNFKYWVYNVTDSDYSALAQEPLFTRTFSFYPIAPLVIEEERITPELDADLYKTTKRLLNKLNIGIEDILDNMLDPEKNPDFDKVYDAFISLSVNIQSDEEASKEYIYKFFEVSYVKENDDKSKIAWDSWWELQGTARSQSQPPMSSFNVSSGKYRYGLYFHYITSEIVTPDASAEVGSIVITSDIQDALKWGTNDMFRVERSVLHITKKISNTESRQLSVYGIMSRTFIKLDGSRDRVALAGLVEDGANVGTFMLPVSPELLKELPIRFRNNLLYEAVNLEIYVKEIVHLQWYQTADFGQFMFVIGRALTVYFLITTGIDVYAAFSEAFLKGVTVLITKLVVSRVLVEGIELLVDLLGAEYALLIVAIASLVNAANGGTTEFNIPGLPDAVTLAQMATAGFSAINNVVEDDFLKLLKEQDEFSELLKDKQEELEKLEDLLGGNVLSPYTISREPYPLSIYESADDYYLRVVEDTNPGIRSLEAIESYVENMTTLPTTPQLLAEYS